MFKKLRLVSIVFIASVLALSLTMVPTSATEGHVSYLETSNFFNLPDEELLEAISEGKIGLSHVRSIYDTSYSLEPKIHSKFDIFVNNISISTPYMNVMQQSAIKSASGDELSFGDAFQYSKLLSQYEQLAFIVVYNSSSSEMSNVDFVIRQNENVFEPEDIVGKNNYPEKTLRWPDFPAYQSTLSPVFFNSDYDIKIDFSNPAELIVIHAPGVESVYEVDFSKYK